ncbi:MAG: hypothetical protein U9R75_12640 [Candidatus Thermoplasmatota archaeon]|nr:hypothetical protein [Candidatus Thermoplasmatota archaeon]
MTGKNDNAENWEAGDEKDNTEQAELKKMSAFSRSFIMPYEKVHFYKDLRTFSQKYMAVIFSLMITLFTAGLFVTIGIIEEDAEFLLIIGGIFFALGMIITIIIFIMRSIPELILTDMRVIHLSSRKGNSRIEECPYDKLNGFEARKVRKLLPIIIGILLIIGGLCFFPLGIANMEEETESYQDENTGNWEEREVDPDAINYMGPFLLGSFLVIIGILILIFLGFTFNYVFKMGGGNITVPCSGRSNRENAGIINRILMDIRKNGKYDG